MAGAIFAYPMIENAIRGNRGRTIANHGLEMGKLFSGFAAVAAGNVKLTKIAWMMPRVLPSDIAKAKLYEIIEIISIVHFIISIVSLLVDQKASRHVGNHQISSTLSENLATFE